MIDLPDTALGQFFKRLLYDIPKREKSAKQQPKGNYYMYINTI